MWDHHILPCHSCDSDGASQLEVILAAQALNLGRSWWTVTSQIATLANFYLTTWEEYHTGQLYLGVFSGPVEGILIIIAIYVITGLYGPSFWDKGILTVIKLEWIPGITDVVPNIALNEAFMLFAAFALAFNIISSYMNVRRATLSKHTSTVRPLLSLLPFVATTGIQVIWLNQPTYNDSAIINSAVFVPFLCAWGLQFAHQVGRMILAHITSTPFPWWDWMWIWSVLGAVDANLPRLTGRAPFIQSSQANTVIFVYLTFLISLAAYARFCALVIDDVTGYLGIACFTVRKKNSNGQWQDAGNGFFDEKKM